MPIGSTDRGLAGTTRERVAEPQVHDGESTTWQLGHR